MNHALFSRLQVLDLRQKEIIRQLSAPDTQANRKNYQKLSQEYSQNQPYLKHFHTYCKTKKELNGVEKMQDDPDEEIGEFAAEEAETLRRRLAVITEKIHDCLYHEDSQQIQSLFLEIRAGTGGLEAAIFAGNLFRMYCRYAENQNWKIETINLSEGEHGGFREAIVRMRGPGIYNLLQSESGVHRVQRIPETESQGRIHTSAATVAVLPENEKTGEIELLPSELRIDTFRASGAGGQHVNKTDSAIRIVHLPTGIKVECQDESSQHRNRERAMSLLKARILDKIERENRMNLAAQRKSLVGGGDRSERIRTYNFPQRRVTDHRIDLTLYRLPELMEGALELLLEPLAQKRQTERMLESV